MRDCVGTEKIDGTNAQVYIVQSLAPEEGAIAHKSLGAAGDLSMFAGSRTRWITPEADNFGFARWVKEHAEELWGLGPGQHFGEWWGNGIQRGYGLQNGDKRFSLFNTARWNPAYQARLAGHETDGIPACCHVVPIVYEGSFDSFMGHSQDVLEQLVKYGSRAAPGFMKPEGIVVWHEAARQLFKTTLDNDAMPKGRVAA
jgi:hypothetical protein